MSHARTVTRLAGVALALAVASPVTAQWGQFRGPNGSGVDTSTGYPVAFSPTSGVAWKAAVPYGQSSPVVVGSRLYVTARDGEQLVTIAFDAATGREQWRRGIRPAQWQASYK